MDVVARLDAPCEPGVVFPWVDDLARYPQWLSIVTRAERLAPADGPPAWLVDLTGRMGPLARSKRLRMVRSACEPPYVARFERREEDGRHHSAWVLTATIEPVDAGSRLTMHLHYGGGLWGPVLEHLLGDEIEQGSRRLLDLLGPSV